MSPSQTSQTQLLQPDIRAALSIIQNWWLNKIPVLRGLIFPILFALSEVLKLDEAPPLSLQEAEKLEKAAIAAFIRYTRLRWLYLGNRYELAEYIFSAIRWARFNLHHQHQVAREETWIEPRKAAKGAWPEFFFPGLRFQLEPYCQLSPETIRDLQPEFGDALAHVALDRLLR